MSATDTLVGVERSHIETFDQSDVRTFARLSGDDNDLHLDREAAAQSRFGERVVHGQLVAGAVSAALAQLPGTVILLEQSLQFVAPVRPGEMVVAEVAIVESAGPDAWTVDATVRTSAAQTVLEGEATVLLDAVGGGE
jgi:acyl dehydratase